MSDGFVVRPFAFMRLTHEAIRIERASLLARAEVLAADPTAAHLQAVQGSLAELERCIELHAAQEEGGFFPMLDAQFESAATAAGFYDEHVAEDARFERVHQALAAVEAQLDGSQAANLLAAVRDWAEANEAHLVHEEDIMMPLTQRVSDTLEGRAAAVRSIIDVGDAEQTVGWQIPWVLARLHAHRPFGPVRMYVAALQATHPEDFDRLRPAIHQALPAEATAKLAALGHL